MLRVCLSFIRFFFHICKITIIALTGIKKITVPRRPNFNPANQTKTASYWKLLDQLTETEVDELDETYRSRLRALQAVDEMVGSLFEELESQGKLDNTYIIYSADNG